MADENRVELQWAAGAESDAEVVRKNNVIWSLQRLELLLSLKYKGYLFAGQRLVAGG